MGYDFDLNETIRDGLEGNIYFRETKAAQYPKDWRNAAAANQCKALLIGTVSAKWREQYEALMTAMFALAESDGSVTLRMSEADSEIFRTIGFGSNPESMDDIAEDICNSLAGIKAERESAAEADRSIGARALSPQAMVQNIYDDCKGDRHAAAAAVRDAARTNAVLLDYIADVGSKTVVGNLIRSDRKDAYQGTVGADVTRPRMPVPDTSEHKARIAMRHEIEVRLLMESAKRASRRKAK